MDKEPYGSQFRVKSQTSQIVGIRYHEAVGNGVCGGVW